MGLLDIFDTDQGRLAMGLLSAAGPSRDPMSFGQRLFGAMQGFDQYRNQKADRATAEEERKRRAAMQDLQMRQITEAMAAQQAQRQAQAAALQKRNSYLDAIDPSKGPAMPASVPSGLAAGLDIGELKALMPQQAAKPEYKTVGGSLVRIGPDGVTPVFQSPDKPEKDPEQLRILKAIYGEGTPAYAKAAQALGLKMTTHQPGTSISLGSPVPITMPDGSVGLVQPANRPGEPPQIMRLPDGSFARPQKDPPAAVIDKMATNAVTLQKIDTALALVEKSPNSLGAKNYLGDPIMQRVDPAGVEVRAMIADIGGQKIHDRSGAAVTVGESERLKPYIPAATDTPAVAKKKLELFRKEYAAMQQALASGASIRQAAMAGGSPGQPSGKKPVRTGRDANGRKVVQYDDGSIDYAD